MVQAGSGRRHPGRERGPHGNGFVQSPSIRGAARAGAPELQPTNGPSAMTIREFQAVIRRMYHDKDAARGVEGTFMWLTEEIGELATALRSGTHEEQSLEFADVLAWLATIANVVDVDLEAAIARKYGGGCPGCGQLACTCPDAEKP